MDAYAYLIKHGWSGPGNPLNPDRAGARGGLGLTKPLLVARRSGNSGIGKTTTKDPTNQWWLRGFEDALKGIGNEKKEDMGVVGKGNALTSELYRFFVRGETVPGTLGNKGQKEKEVLGKRKRGVGEKETKEEKRVRREEKKRRKEEKAKRKAEKEERRRARAEKREVKAKRAEEKAERKKLKAEAKERKEKKPEDDYPTPVSMDLDSTDAQDATSSDTKPVKEKKEKKGKKDKKENKRDTFSSSEEPSKRKSKKSKST
ncbi:uncharacterized protein BDV14DRAFT_163340 [Aspergillus stella-maris]|uniref:uncharacterized protein n=1 Tax=Aspergillus stella-maris TaxID=1810926 RepID=UPI003CCDD0AD